MKAEPSAVVVLFLLSVTGIAWLADRQRAEPSSLLVPLEPRTTGQHFVLAEAQPLILLGFHPEEGTHHIEVRDRQGRIQWTHRLREGEKLGNARLSADGKYLVYDYYIFKPPRAWLAPHEEVRYRGGIRCVRQDGTIVWESRSQGISEGSPSCSPEGCVEQVAGNQVLIARHGWEIIERITVRNLQTGRQVFTRTSPVEIAGLAPDGSFLVVSGRTRREPYHYWTQVVHLESGAQFQVDGAVLPTFVYNVPPQKCLTRSYVLMEVASEPDFIRSLGLNSRPARQRSAEEGNPMMAIITPVGKLAWMGSWRFDAGEEPRPTLQDDGKDVSWYASQDWQIKNVQLGQYGDRVVLLWENGKRRRLLLFDAPERGQGRLVLQRVVALPSPRTGEWSLLSPDGKVVAIYRVSMDGSSGLLHVHFWNQEGRLIGEASVLGYPKGDDETPRMPEVAWFTPDHRYLAISLCHWSPHPPRPGGYAIVRVPIGSATGTK
jgi:hypothetical protein